MSRLWEYLKTHRRRKLKVFNIVWTVLCGLNIIRYAVDLADGEENAVFLVLWGALGVVYLYADFFQMPGEKEISVDPRAMEERLRETFAKLSPEELQAIMDDDLRSEEVKAIAGELLKS